MVLGPIDYGRLNVLALGVQWVLGESAAGAVWSFILFLYFYILFLLYLSTIPCTIIGTYVYLYMKKEALPTSPTSLALNNNN